MTAVKKTFYKIDGQTFDGATMTIPADRTFRDAWMSSGEGVIEVDWAKARQQFREVATLPKPDFCIRLAQAGILTQQEAISAAKGEWPAPFDATLQNVSADLAFEAQVKWASASVIHRNHPMIAPLIKAAGITDEQADQIFGYTGQ